MTAATARTPSAPAQRTPARHVMTRCEEDTNAHADGRTGPDGEQDLRALDPMPRATTTSRTWCCSPPASPCYRIGKTGDAYPNPR
jgi:hypothetical protein